MQIEVLSFSDGHLDAAADDHLAQAVGTWRVRSKNAIPT